MKSRGKEIITVGVIQKIKHYDRDLKTLSGHSQGKGVMETFWLLGHAENGALPANNAQGRQPATKAATTRMRKMCRNYMHSMESSTATCG
uniref:Uncharacterized protein n=1 Tax=Globodera rostochiensis TaxID=31243 RepID=A0A914H628_GLORO